MPRTEAVDNIQGTSETTQGMFSNQRESTEEALRVDRYIKGQNWVLDKKSLAYKKINLWAGFGLGEALNGDEVDTMVDLNKKEKRVALKLTVQEVSTLGA